LQYPFGFNLSCSQRWLVGSVAAALTAHVVSWAGASPGKTGPESGPKTAPKTGPAANPSVFSDYRSQAPGVVHRITARDLPEPFATPSVDNGPRLVPRPPGAWPQAPSGFKVELYAAKLAAPRLIRTAPNGDVFVVESKAGNLRVLRGSGDKGRAETTALFASGLNRPFGVAFYPVNGPPGWLYAANTDSVVRFPYQSGDLKARGPAEVVVPALPGGGQLRGGGHWTRDLAFSLDGKKMFVSVGSRSNNDDSDENPDEFHRADILEFNPDGSGMRVFASGIRNAVGIAIQPGSGTLWASVNERDELGDNLVPDYITHVADGGFYGWPWFYIGGHPDPRHAGKHPERAAHVLVPDVLLQPHNASLQLTFYDGGQFPAAYRGDIFAAQHGSWNKAIRTGYEVIRVPLGGQGKAQGEYEDFLTGFVTATGNVWGRPVGVAVAKDGALLVSDDAFNAVWRVSYQGH
jgi:glucose/arabinose dehydrogenase